MVYCQRLQQCGAARRTASPSAKIVRSSRTCATCQVFGPAEPPRPPSGTAGSFVRVPLHRAAQLRGTLFALALADAGARARWPTLPVPSPNGHATPWAVA
jgi:hypothetical protein